MTLCSMCYNTLARANQLMREDEEKRKTLNLFMDEENDYAGEVEVVHYLDLLQREIGWDKLAAAVKKPLTGPARGGVLRLHPAAAPRGGHRAARPRRRCSTTSSRALGAEAVDFAEAQACCCSYQILGNEGAALEASAKVLRSATETEVDALAMSCPVCEYNLGRRQGDMRDEARGGR